MKEGDLGRRGFTPHPLRGAVLGESHARPFHPMPAPRRVLHLAFLSGPEGVASDWEALDRYCQARGLSGPAANARHHRATFAEGSLRWENHTEFSTYTFEFDSDAGHAPFKPERPALERVFDGLDPAGQLVVAVDLHLIAAGTVADASLLFDASGLAYSDMDDGAARAVTDLKPTTDGYTRILVVDHGLAPARAGALVIRLLEIETYRMLALLGLPDAQSLAPRVRAMETRLVEITRAIRENDAFAANEALLDRLTALAAELSAESAAHSYRFGATRAYDQIVGQRLDAVREQPVKGHDTWAGFLARRQAPAMRTCRIVEGRLGDLADKVARAATLLRARVDVELERQNRDLLQSMNERTRMQLRLQRTVEGLSVAAVSYYVVGLIAYLAKGAEKSGLAIAPEIVVAAALPLVVAGIWLTVRRIRRHAES
jgi:uncharacterized membrane-anchored protein